MFVKVTCRVSRIVEVVDASIKSEKIGDMQANGKLEDGSKLFSYYDMTVTH